MTSLPSSWVHPRTLPFCQATLANMAGNESPWRDGRRAWERLRRWSRGKSGSTPGPDPGEALTALADIGLVRRLLDNTELAAVKAARQQHKSWAEVATKLGVTRQSAWERWRDLDDAGDRSSTSGFAAIGPAGTGIVGHGLARSRWRISRCPRTTPPDARPEVNSGRTRGFAGQDHPLTKGGPPGGRGRLPCDVVHREDRKTLFIPPWVC